MVEEPTNIVQEIRPVPQKLKRWYVVAGSAFAVLLTASFFLYYFYADTPFMEERNQESPYEEALVIQARLKDGSDTASKEYLAAIAAYERGEGYEGAIRHFRSALAAATDPVEKLMIRYALAQTESWRSGKESEAIDLLKELAADSLTPAVVRGSVVERMGSMVYGGTSDAVLGAVYASDDFYEDFGVEGDFASSMKNLFEYGSSLYPTAYMQYWIANWYASDMVALERGRAARTNHSKRELESIVEELIRKGDDDIAAFREAYEKSWRTSPAMLRKAILAETLAAANSSISLGDPDDLFQAAFAEGRMADAPDAEAWALYEWALYQAQNNFPEGVNDARETLKKLYESDRYLGTHFAGYLRRAGGLEAGSTEGRRQIELLATIDPGFGSLLENELGWENLPKLQQ